MRIKFYGAAGTSAKSIEVSSEMGPSPAIFVAEYFIL
jgi:hypothetical protein